MKINNVKIKLKAGGVAVGALLPFFAPTAVEILGYAGCDFVTFDAEHGPLTAMEIESMTRAADCVGIVPLARVESNAPSAILRLMDVGVLGVQIPHISTREDAASAVQAVKYHPLGCRGLAGSVRAANYTSMASQDYVRMSNENSLVIVQIEDIASLPHLKEILSVEGVDAVFIGQNDLSNSMGFSGNTGHREVQRVVDKIFTATLENGLVVAVSTDVKSSKHWIERGAKFISLSFVPTMLKSWASMLNEVKSYE